jgi:toxin CcdB
VAQFDAFPNPLASQRRAFPLVISLRSDLIAASSDAVIAPLVPRRQLAGALGRLNPLVQLDQEEYVVLVDRLTTIPVSSLPRRIANLARHREALLGAVDLLFYGV